MDAKNKKFSDPYPTNLGDVQTDIDYWASRQHEGAPGSEFDQQIRSRLEHLRHLHDRYSRQAKPVSDPDQQSQKPKAHSGRPDFIDTLIIIFVSAAAIIFIFWISSQTLNLENFITVPEFIRDSFKAIWSSIAAGATGIGLAAYKAFTRTASQPRPNYLLLIGATTLSILILIFVMLLFLQSLGTRFHFSPPSDTDLLEVDSPTAISHALNLKADPLGNTYYQMTGHYSIKGRAIEGTVEKAMVEIDKSKTPFLPMHYQNLQVMVCYVDRSQGNEFLNGFPNGMTPQWANSTRIDVDSSPGLKQDLPGFNFKLTIPDYIKSRKLWLCSALGFPGGYVPGHQVSSQLDLKPTGPR